MLSTPRAACAPRRRRRSPAPPRRAARRWSRRTSASRLDERRRLQVARRRQRRTVADRRSEQARSSPRPPDPSVRPDLCDAPCHRTSAALDVEAAGDPPRGDAGQQRRSPAGSSPGRTARRCAGCSPALELVCDPAREGVDPGSNSEAWICGDGRRSTSETAIASPSARPSPSTTAAATPDAVVGSTTPRIISQRVAPKRRCAVLELLRNRQEQVAAERRDDRQHHHRQDESGGEQAQAGRLTAHRTAG